MSQSVLATTLNQIVSEYGIEILHNDKRLTAMFADYCPNNRAEKNKLKIAVEFGVVGQLGKASGNALKDTMACKKAIMVLKEQAFLDESVATAIVCDFADVMKLKYDPAMLSDGASQPASAPQAPASLGKSSREETEPYVPEWVPGSGIGYSSHDNPYSLSSAYYVLEDRLFVEFAPDLNSLQAFSIKQQLKKKKKIADEWYEARSLCNVYDAMLLDGESPAAAAKYKKYNERYLKELEEEFWS